MRKSKKSTRRLVVCVKNKGYAVSLEKRKIYVALPDPNAAKHDLIRVIDESGEDYLFPSTYFISIRLPQPVRKAVFTAA